MPLKIVWTPQAEKSLQNVIDYLENRWTINEINRLKKHLQKLLDSISKYPTICPATKKHRHVYKGLVDKNNYIIYRIHPKKYLVEILNFRGTKQKPIY